MRVGPENGGWRLITLQLNHERVGLAAFGSLALELLDEVVEWARRTHQENGRPVIETPWVQMSLGEAQARLEALKVMNWRMAWEVGQGRLDPAHASAAKIYGTETVIDVYRLLLEVVGEEAWRACQINTFGGGVNEVQREIVATLGLGMPRAPR
jgi:alkylation response protein AidB-like acyl-CoA dehydrogenase